MSLPVASFDTRIEKSLCFQWGNYFCHSTRGLLASGLAGPTGQSAPTCSQVAGGAVLRRHPDLRPDRRAAPVYSAHTPGKLACSVGVGAGRRGGRVCGVRQVGGLEVWPACRPVAQRPSDSAFRNGHPRFFAKRKMPRKLHLTVALQKHILLSFPEFS